MADAKEDFHRAIESAIDWAVEGGLSVDDMTRELREWIETMEKYPSEFRP